MTHLVEGCRWAGCMPEIQCYARNLYDMYGDVQYVSAADSATTTTLSELLSRYLRARRPRVKSIDDVDKCSNRNLLMQQLDMALILNAVVLEELLIADGLKKLESLDEVVEASQRILYDERQKRIDGVMDKCNGTATCAPPPASTTTSF